LHHRTCHHEKKIEKKNYQDTQHRIWIHWKRQQGKPSIHICFNGFHSMNIHRGFLVKFNQIAELGFGLDA